MIVPPCNFVVCKFVLLQFVSSWLIAILWKTRGTNMCLRDVIFIHPFVMLCWLLFILWIPETWSIIKLVDWVGLKKESNRIPCSFVRSFFGSGLSLKLPALVKLVKFASPSLVVGLGIVCSLENQTWHRPSLLIKLSCPSNIVKETAEEWLNVYPSYWRSMVLSAVASIVRLWIRYIIKLIGFWLVYWSIKKNYIIIFFKMKGTFIITYPTYSVLTYK